MRLPVVLAFLLLGCAHAASATAAPPVHAPSNLPASLPRLGATSARGAELFVDVAGGRLFTVTPSGQLAAFALSSGRELWAKEAPPLAWPLLVEPRGRLLSVEVGGSGAMLVRRDVATGAVVWRAPLPLPPEVQPATGFEDRFLVTSAVREGKTFVCWSWSHHPASGARVENLPPPKFAAGGVRLAGDIVEPGSRAACGGDEQVPLPASVTASLKPKEWLCSSAGLAPDGRNFVLGCGFSSGFVLAWSDAGVVERIALRGQAQPRVTRQSLVLMGGEVRTLRDETLAVVPRTLTETQEPDPRFGGSPTTETRALEDETLTRLPDGWITTWTAQSRPRLIRRLNADGGERWRVLGRDDVALIQPPP